MTLYQRYRRLMYHLDKPFKKYLLDMLKETWNIILNMILAFLIMFIVFFILKYFKLGI